VSDLRRLGREAEDRAAAYLLNLGYTIVTRRFKATRGEIDIVALDGETVVFVEVKWRRGRSQTPESAISHDKVALLRESALEYLYKAENPEQMIRFDLVAIDPDGLRHYVNAFHG